MDQKTRCMKLAYWTGIIKESKSSGMKVSEWCLENHISIRKYYYWHKRVMHGAYDAAVETGLLPAPDADSFSVASAKVPEFAELSIPNKTITREQDNGPGVKIRFHDFTISVDEGFSERELAKVLQVMSHV